VPVGLNLDHPTTTVPGPGADGDISQVNHQLHIVCRQGALSEFDAWLLIASHIHDTPIPTLTNLYGRSRTTLYAHHAQAEHRLRQLQRANQHR
jgi:hypothetical protein